ncbi:MAG: TonB-dependent receptor [Burkholderiales bacterium RIFOXYD2_FULL_59_8]|nr:MAG: TonB-dependent receptor [Burkholderiales bacterium RIFOXYD2_FULL_59_8]
MDQLMPLSLLELINLPVVTASRQLETRDQTPSHILVFTREQIRERRYNNLADLLEDLPGVDFMRGTKSSAFNNLTVQGHSGPNKLLVMMDGVRIGNPAGGNFPIAENFALYPARQVEVLFGPAAALYGADAVAGVVNIITDQGDGTMDSWVSLGSGAFGNTETSFMTGTRTENGLALSLGGHWQRADRAPLNNFYPGDFPRKDAATFGGLVLVPAAKREAYVGGISSYSLFARLDLDKQVSAGFYRNVFRSLTSTGDKPETALYLEDARWITQTDTLYAKYRFDPGADVSAELALDYALQTVDPASRYFNIYTGFANGFEYTRGERLALEQNLNWRVSTQHRVQAGLGVQKYAAIEAHTLPSPYDTTKDAADQGLLYPNTTLPLAIHEASYSNVSAYGQVQSDWNAQWSTMAGVRVDRHSSYGTSVNPRLGAVWRANPQHVFKALYAEAFRAPSPEESLSSFGSFDGTTTTAGLYRGTGFRVANLDLEPETSKTLSLTWDWRPAHDVNMVANAFHSRIKNLIVTLPSTAVNAIAGAELINPESKGNAGEQTQTGLDLMARYQFRLNRAWSGDLWGSASWINGKINEGDGIDWALGFVASQKYKLGATLRYLDKISVTPQLLWIGDTSNGRKKDKNLPPDRLETPGYTVVNLHLGWHKLLGGKTTLWLELHNLFDTRYYAAHGAGSRTFFDMPQQPRSWMLSLDHRF